MTVAVAPPRGHPRLRAVVRSPLLMLGSLILVLVVLGWRLEPGVYLTSANVGTVAETMTVPLIVALGACIGLLGGVVDLSVGSVVGFSATVFAVVLESTGSAWGAGVAALGAGLAVGAVNGVVSIVFGAEPIIATLGALVGVQGLALVLDHSRSKIAFVVGWDDAVHYPLGPVDAPFVVVVAVLVATVFVLKVRPGRHVSAVGGNRSSAARAGIRSAPIQFALLLFTALAASVGGLVYVGQLGAAPSQLGTGMELQVFAAIPLAGFSIARGGVGNPLAAAVGVAALAMLSSLLDLTGVISFRQDIITGCLLLGAVGLDVVRRGAEFS